MRAGLIDDLAYEDEVDDKIKLAPGETSYLEMSDYRQVSAASLGLDRGPRIAIIYASGLIASGRSNDSPGGDVVGSDTINEYLRKARADSSVRAIVLRIDSPGGSAIASDIIWREMLLTKNRKPLIASMSDVAASGGYYIAMPAHAIVAEPSTLTGSIGVVLTKFVIDGTLKKLGMNMEGVARGRYADLYSPVKPFSPEEKRARLREHAGDLRHVRREGGAGAEHDARKDRRDRSGPGLDRASGEGDRAGRRTGRPRSRHRARQAARADSAGVGSRAGHLSAAEDRSTTTCAARSGRPTAARRWRRMLGLRNPRVVQALTAPLQVFRRGEPLALMPNVFVH